MDWVTHAVSAFGQSVGVGALALDADGCFTFMLEPGGTLSLQDLLPAGGDDVLVTLAQPLPPPPAASLRQALRLADFRVRPGWQAQLALRGELLAVTLRMPRHAVIQSALEDAVEALFDFHARLSQAS